MSTYSPWFVLVLGMATVFVGLICLIFLTKLLSLVVNASGKKKLNKESAAPVAATPEKASEPLPAAAASAPAQDRRQFVAVLSAAIAAHIGTDVEGLRIHSITPLFDDSSDADKAAVQAALAVVMRRDPNALRIYSMRRV